MEKFKVTIENMVDLNFRHHMEKFIEDYGFVVIGGGCDLTGNEMNISFENPITNIIPLTVAVNLNLLLVD